MSAESKTRSRPAAATSAVRSEYKKVWNDQAQAADLASIAVAGHSDEATLEVTARGFIDTLRSTCGVTRNDVILEIGCGIARVGKPLSQECLRWYGADISGTMLAHAAARLKDRPNARLVELATVGLQEFPRDAFDLVYCTIVFMHLYEWDRYRYVEEAFRVLRPGGRCYFDNFSLDSEVGWNVFLEGARYPVERRPAHMSLSSTREELGIYLKRAGFEDIVIHDLPNQLIAVTGRKPAGR